jgi:hypothetical protein
MVPAARSTSVAWTARSSVTEPPSGSDTVTNPDKPGANPSGGVIHRPPREAPPRTVEVGGWSGGIVTVGFILGSRNRVPVGVIGMTRSGSATVVASPPVVTAAQMVAGHVGLDITCLDRLYLTGFVAKLQTPGGVVYFLHDHRGNPIASPALFERIGHTFREAVKDWVQANGVPVIMFKAGDRKTDVMAPYLQAAADAGVSKVVAVGRAQESALVWTARRRETELGNAPQFSFTKEQRRVSVFYFYIWDERMGPGFIKICTYFPYPIKVWVNGHEWAKRQAIAAGIGFTELSNGFATCTDPAGLQEICDRFGPGTVQVWFERWMARIPLPLTDADRDGGFWWDLSMRQIETSRTLVFNDDVHARAFFEALLVENMDLGRPENVELLFRRGQRSGRPTFPPVGGFKTKIDQRCELVTLNVFYRHSRLKQYLKEGVAGACASMLMAVTGITNQTLRGWMTGLLDRPYSMNQASYDLARLARNGLIERVPGKNRYILTHDGLLFAHLYTKIYDHVLRPLMATDRPNAPPELLAALDTLDQIVAERIAHARVPTTA